MVHYLRYIKLLSFLLFFIASTNLYAAPIDVPDLPIDPCTGQFPDKVNLSQHELCGPFILDVVVNEGCKVVAQGIECSCNNLSEGDDCQVDCMEAYTAPSIVALTAVPDPGFEFVEWSEQCIGDSANVTIAVNTNLLCKANCKSIDEQQEIEISVDGGVDSEGDVIEDVEFIVVPNNDGDIYENVNIVFNFPEGIIVNSASTSANSEVANVVQENGCTVLNDTQIDCFINELSEENIISVNMFVPNLGETLQAVAMVTTDTVPGQALEQILNIIAGRADDGVNSVGSGTGGCSIAQSSNAEMKLLFFALIPTAIIFRRIGRK